MSTTALTGGAAGAPASGGGGGMCRRKRRCGVSRRTGALLVGGTSVVILLASMSATMFGIVTAPNSTSVVHPGAESLLRSGGQLEGRHRPAGPKKKGAPGKSVGGILVEGGLRDPASGGGSNAPVDHEPEENEQEQEQEQEGQQGTALIVVGSTGAGGDGGGRLVGSAGGGQLFFAPVTDQRPVYIVRQPNGGVIVSAPGGFTTDGDGDGTTNDDTAADGDGTAGNDTAEERRDGSVSRRDTASVSDGLLLMIDKSLPSGDDDNSTHAISAPSSSNSTETTSTISPSNSTETTSTISPSNSTDTTSAPSSSNSTETTSTISPSNSTDTTSTPGSSNSTETTSTISSSNSTETTSTISPNNSTETTSTPGSSNSTDTTNTPGSSNSTDTTNTPGSSNSTDTTSTISPSNSTENTDATGSSNSSTTTARPGLEPPPLTEHLWLRVERGPLGVALALQLVFLVLTVLMLYGVRQQRQDLVLLWLVAAAFGLSVGSAGGVLSALSAFDADTAGGYLVGFAYLIGLVLLWCGWAVVVAYHRQATPPEFDNTHPHFC